MEAVFGVAATLVGVGLIVLGFREAPPRCTFCNQAKKRFPPAAAKSREHTHYCANPRCERYEFGGPVLRFGDER
jgi:hypothetical protein